MKRWAGCGAVTLLLHAWLLAHWPVIDATPPHERWLHLRLFARRPVMSPANPATPPDSGGVSVARADGPRAEVAGAAQTAGRQPTRAGRSSSGSSRLPAPGQVVAVPSRGSVPAIDTAARDIPVYPTALPPSGTWRYRLLHNGRAGEAELQWQHEADQYSARLDAREDGVQTLVLRSSGRLDAAGLAPERFIDLRGRRGAQAANFRHDAGAITYSGPALQRPLPAGAQDRLSLWLQLAAIVAAQPGRWSPGSQITTYATGARADAEVWTWTVQGLVPVDDGRAHSPLALQLHRDPLRPYDTEADAWLDPAHGYLPVRLRWRNGPYAFELRLLP